MSDNTKLTLDNMKELGINDNFWFGVGVGQSSVLHTKYSFGRKVATHTEFGRI